MNTDPGEFGFLFDNSLQKTKNIAKEVDRHNQLQNKTKVISFKQKPIAKIQ